MKRGIFGLIILGLMVIIAGRTFSATVSVSDRAEKNTVLTSTQLVVTSDSTNVSTDVYYLQRGFSKKYSSVNRMCAQYLVQHIDTNIIVALQGSLDGTNFFNLDEDGNTTITANGTYSFVLIGTSVFPYTRFTIISCSGDSTTTVDNKWKWGE